MRPLQDKCEPTPFSAVQELFLSDMGAPIEELFDEFDPVPIGVASLAQVHVGRMRGGGRVAVKVSRGSFSLGGKGTDGNGGNGDGV